MTKPARKNCDAENGPAIDANTNGDTGFATAQSAPAKLRRMMRPRGAIRRFIGGGQMHPRFKKYLLKYGNFKPRS